MSACLLNSKWKKLAMKKDDLMEITTLLILPFLLKLKLDIHLDRPYLWFKPGNSKNGITISSNKCLIGFTWVISFPEILWLVSTKKNAHFHMFFKWSLCGVIKGLLPQSIPSNSHRLANSLSKTQINKIERKKDLS